MAILLNHIQTLPGTTPEMDSAYGNWAILPAAAGNVALTLTVNMPRIEGEIFFYQDATGNRTLSINGTAIEVNPAANSRTKINWAWDGSNYHYHPNYKGSGTGGGGTDPVNAAPTVSLSASNESPDEGTTITLTATASDTDGTISKVDFYEGDSLLGSYTAPPYIHTINSITAGAHSYFAVAFDDDNATATSDTVVVSTVALIAAPTNLTAGSTNGSTIELNWTDNSNGEDQFHIERSVNDGAFSEIATVAANTVTYSDAAVSQNNRYTYRVRGRKGSYYTEYSNLSQSAIVYAYDFDGVNKVISFDGASMYGMGTTSAFTIAAWVYNDVAGNVVRILSKYDVANNKGIRFSVDGTGRLMFQMRSGSSQLLVYSASDEFRSGILTAQKWYHVAATYPGSGGAAAVKFYVDGVYYNLTTLQNNTLGTVSISNTKTLYFGGEPDSSVYSNHKQAVTRIFNKVLDGNQISALYNKGLPLYDASAIGGMTLEMLVNPDTFNGTKWSVTGTAGNAAGSSVNMTINDRILVYDLDAIKATNIQPYTGNSLYYNTYGNAGGEDAAYLMHSPFTDRRHGNILWDSATGKTFIAWMKRGNLGWNRSSMLMHLNHEQKYASPSYAAPYISPGVIDGHPAPSIVLTADGEILLAHEDVHNSPIYFSKTTGKEARTLANLATLGGTLAYPALHRIGSRIYLYARGVSLTGQDSSVYLQRDSITWSDDNGATWAALKEVLNLNNSTGMDRAYFFPVYDPNKLRYFIQMREDSISNFTRIYYIESTDGVNWKNISGSFTKDITSASITRAEMDANFLVKYDNDNTLHIKAAVMTPNGPACLANDSVNNYQYLYYNAGWQSRPVNIPLFAIKTPPGNGQYDAYWVVYAYDNNHFVWWRIENRNSYDVVVQYETLDAFQTWDAGTVISDAAKNHEQIQGTYNINEAGKVVIACSELGATQNSLFFYEWTP